MFIMYKNLKAHTSYDKCTFHLHKNISKFSNGTCMATGTNKIRDIFKVKLYAIRSETKKREREKGEREKNERVRKKREREK